jgi:hypothetical protein
MADIRPPAVAGMFYPAEAQTLRRQIQLYLDDADPPDLAPVRAIIAPHAGYTYSGPVAGFAYKLLKAQNWEPHRILIMGPSHRAWFPGVAIADVDGFRTPLGVQPVDRAYAHRLSGKSRLFSAITSPHTPEHCLEVQVPFIQTIFPDTPIVPMLFGEVNPEEVAKVLDAEIDDHTFIIVSSDLSHYHDNRTAHAIDGRLLNAVLNQDKPGVVTGEACGQAPILSLMTLAERHNWRPHLLDYRTSGDITGSHSQVVGYAAIAYVGEAQ